MERKKTITRDGILQILHDNREVILKNVVPCEETYEVFLQLNLITETLVNDLREETGRLPKVVRLVDYISSRIQTMEGFCNALQMSGHGYLADFLRCEVERGERGRALREEEMVDINFIKKFFGELKTKVTERVDINDIYTYLRMKLKEFVYTMNWRSEIDSKEVAFLAKEQQISDLIQYKTAMAKHDQEIRQLKYKLEESISNSDAKGNELRGVIKYLTELKDKHKEEMQIVTNYYSAGERHMKRMEERERQHNAVAHNIFIKIDRYLRDVNLEAGNPQEWIKDPRIETSTSPHEKAEYAMEKLLQRVEELEEIRGEYDDLPPSVVMAVLSRKTQKFSKIDRVRLTQELEEKVALLTAANSELEANLQSANQEKENLDDQLLKVRLKCKKERDALKKEIQTINEANAMRTGNVNALPAIKTETVPAQMEECRPSLIPENKRSSRLDQNKSGGAIMNKYLKAVDEVQNERKLGQEMHKKLRALEEEYYKVIREKDKLQTTLSTLGVAKSRSSIANAQGLRLKSIAEMRSKSIADRRRSTVPNEKRKLHGENLEDKETQTTITLISRPVQTGLSADEKGFTGMYGEFWKHATEEEIVDTAAELIRVLISDSQKELKRQEAERILAEKELKRSESRRRKKGKRYSGHEDDKRVDLLGLNDSMDDAAKQLKRAGKKKRKSMYEDRGEGGDEASKQKKNKAKKIKSKTDQKEKEYVEEEQTHEDESSISLSKIKKDKILRSKTKSKRNVHITFEKDLWDDDLMTLHVNDIKAFLNKAGRSDLIAMLEEHLGDPTENYVDEVQELDLPAAIRIGLYNEGFMGMKRDESFFIRQGKTRRLGVREDKEAQLYKFHEKVAAKVVGSVAQEALSQIQSSDEDDELALEAKASKGSAKTRAVWEDVGTEEEEEGGLGVRVKRLQSISPTEGREEGVRKKTYVFRPDTERRGTVMSLDDSDEAKQKGTAANFELQQRRATLRRQESSRRQTYAHTLDLEGKADVGSLKSRSLPIPDNSAVGRGRGVGPPSSQVRDPGSKKTIDRLEYYEEDDESEPETMLYRKSEVPRPTFIKEVDAEGNVCFLKKPVLKKAFSYSTVEQRRQLSCGKCDTQEEVNRNFKVRPSMLKKSYSLKYVNAPSPIHIVRLEIIHEGRVVRRDLLQVNTATLEKLFGVPEIVNSINANARDLLKEVLYTIQDYFSRSFAIRLKESEKPAQKPNSRTTQFKVPVLQMNWLDYARLTSILQISAVGQSVTLLPKPGRKVSTKSFQKEVDTILVDMVRTEDENDLRRKQTAESTYGVPVVENTKESSEDTINETFEGSSGTFTETVGDSSLENKTVGDSSLENKDTSAKMSSGETSKDTSKESGGNTPKEDTDEKGNSAYAVKESAEEKAPIDDDTMKESAKGKESVQEGLKESAKDKESVQEGIKYDIQDKKNSKDVIKDERPQELLESNVESTLSDPSQNYSDIKSLLSIDDEDL